MIIDSHVHVLFLEHMVDYVSTAACEPKNCRCFMIEGPDNVKIEFLHYC